MGKRKNIPETNALSAMAGYEVAQRFLEQAVERSRLVNKIVALRRQELACVLIAKDEYVAGVLEQIGVTSESVRTSIVQKIVAAKLDEDERSTIHSRVLGKRVSNLSEAARKKGQEATQIAQWTPEIDAYYLQLLSKMPRRISLEAWQGIASVMNTATGFTLTVQQWRERRQTLLRRS